jgi:fructokinase
VRRFGGIEAGGTKWLCAVGTGPDDVEIVTFPTTTPEETIGRAVGFFERTGDVDAIGIGCFGPVDLDPKSPQWGHITTTPKPGWADTDVAGPVGTVIAGPVAFETDVGAAALGEQRWGAGRGSPVFCYVTVGTGIGGAAVVDGRVLHGARHAEMGHQRIPHHPDDPFPGACPFHGDCWEGLASGPAMMARWGRPGAELADDHPSWDLEAGYLAAGLANIAVVLSVPRFVLGGGVAGHPGLAERVEAGVGALLAGYVPPPTVVSPALGPRAGVLGALVLAERSLD